MSDELNQYLKMKQLREQRQKDISKEKLLKIAKKRIQTTMIGALSSIEETFGGLWENDSVMKEAFEELRSEILDRGNNQIRALESDFSTYEIVWKKYTYQLPFKGKED